MKYAVYVSANELVEPGFAAPRRGSSHLLLGILQFLTSIDPLSREPLGTAIEPL